MCCTGITKTVSAETDAAQLRSSTVAVPLPSTTTIVAGPIVLTTVLAELNSGAGSSIDFYVTTTTCTDTMNRSEIFLVQPGSSPRDNSLPGRFWVPAGSTLCSGGSGGPATATVFFSGFVPY